MKRREFFGVLAGGATALVGTHCGEKRTPGSIPELQSAINHDYDANYQTRVIAAIEKLETAEDTKTKLSARDLLALASEYVTKSVTGIPAVSEDQFIKTYERLAGILYSFEQDELSRQPGAPLFSYQELAENCVHVLVGSSGPEPSKLARAYVGWAIKTFGQDQKFLNDILQNPIRAFFSEDRMGMSDEHHRKPETFATRMRGVKNLFPESELKTQAVEYTMDVLVSKAMNEAKRVKEGDKEARSEQQRIKAGIRAMNTIFPQVAVDPISLKPRQAGRAR